ncbi:hypothetical protein JHK84_041117 [Glycine max]|nr:hypothetical protein JHK84_041117 [Glycine max]
MFLMVSLSLQRPQPSHPHHPQPSLPLPVLAPLLLQPPRFSPSLSPHSPFLLHHASLPLSPPNKFPVPVQGCENLLRRVVRLRPVELERSWAFYLEVLDSGYPPKIYFFNVLMHGFCKVGGVGSARLVFDEIPKRGLRPTVVSFNTLISGCCKAGAVEEGFRLKGVMESERVCPDVFTFSALINGLCKEGRLDEGSLLFDEMCGKGLVPNGVTFTVLIDGQCKGGKVDLALKNFQMMLAQGVRPDLVTYNALVNELGSMKTTPLDVGNFLLLQNGLEPEIDFCSTLCSHLSAYVMSL